MGPKYNIYVGANIMRRQKLRACKNIDCNHFFYSVKAKYCCERCKQKGALEHRKATNIEIFGVDNYFGRDGITGELKEIYLKNLGVDNPMKLKEIKEKAENTMLSRYDTKYP